MVTLMLPNANAVTNGQTVTVSYTAPTSNPIQDLISNDADSLTRHNLTTCCPSPHPKHRSTGRITPWRVFCPAPAPP